MRKTNILLFSTMVLILAVFSCLFFLGNFGDEKSTAQIVLLEPERSNGNLFSNLESVEDNLMKLPSWNSNKKDNSEPKLVNEEKSSVLYSVEGGGNESLEKEARQISDKINFSPPPPLTVCKNEKINLFLSLGRIDVKLDYQSSLSCALNGRKDINIKYCLYEDDTASDDKIVCDYATATTYDCKTTELGQFRGIKVERSFINIQLSDFAGGSEGSTVEIYAEISSTDNYFSAISTKSYDVDTVNCDCISGECCDLRSRPYYFKSSGSQPTGQEDEYYCTGTNWPDYTSYVQKKDWYCDGRSSSAKHSDSIFDTCGICKKCEGGHSSCLNYVFGVTCGNGKGICDGTGNCKEIKCSKDSDCGMSEKVGPKFCSGNDVYQKYKYYQCNNRGTIDSSCGSYESDSNEEECGTSTYSGSNYCYDNDIYRDYLNRGCSNGGCYSTTEKRKQEECGSSGCKVGKCDIPTAIEEYSDLIVDDLIIQNINGRRAVLGFTIKNIGEKKADAVYWMIDTDSPDENPLRTDSLILYPGEFTKAFMILNYSKSGNYNPKVIVDFNNIIAESNENNNERSISVSV